MRKYLAFILAAMFAIAMIGLGTFAWFSSTEQVTGTFQSGVIELDLGGEEQRTFVIEDMKPCDWEVHEVTLVKGEKESIGSNDGPVYLHIDGISGDAALANWITFDLSVNDVVVIHPDDHMKISDLRSISIYLGWLDTAGMELDLSFHLEADTPNSMQAKTCSVIFEFIMTDHNAPPPTSGILLENKDTSWNPILGDGIWGTCRYDVGSLNLDVMAKGLDGETNYQVGISSPNAGDTRLTANEQKAITSALASNVYSSSSPGTAPPTGWNQYERAYYTPGDTNTHTGAYVDGDEGIYSFTQNGDNLWDVDGDDLAAGVSASCDLPSGDYRYIKCLVKMDESPWTGVLMEKNLTLFFTIP